MPVEMWLYLPLSPKCDLDNPPTIDLDGPVIATAIHNFQPPPADADENDDAGGGGGGRRRRGGRRRWNNENPEIAAIEDAHKDRPGWIPILAWSHGASGSSGRYANRGGGNMQDLSMTKYSDLSSPQMTVMVMAGEVLPHGILRVVSMPEDGKLKIIEFVMKNVQISSISTGGSGGEDRLTENITITFNNIFMRHVTINNADGKFLEDSKGTWDSESKKGARDGVFSVQSLKTICKKAVTDNVELYDTRMLAKLPVAILVELDLQHVTAQTKLPLRGRRLLFTADEINEGKRTRYREFFVKKLTVQALVAAAAAVQNVAPDKVKGAYAVVGDSLLLIERNEQVEDIGEDSHIFLALE